MRDMDRWLQQYEYLRTDPDQKASWTSEKYDIEGRHWAEIADIDVLGLYNSEGDIMKWGQACSSLKKTWKLYKRQRREEGLYRGDLAYRILKIQRAMGIKQSEFQELNNEEIDWELSKEEKEAKTEEFKEDWNIETGSEDPEEDDEEEDEDWENW